MVTDIHWQNNLVGSAFQSQGDMQNHLENTKGFWGKCQIWAKEQMEYWKNPHLAEMVLTDTEILQWSTQRIQAAEEIWGVGKLGPEPKQFVTEWMQPLKLGSGKVLLDLGSELGSTGREAGQFYGCQTSSLERDQTLSHEARERSLVVGGAQYNTHTHNTHNTHNIGFVGENSEYPKFSANSCDAILCREQVKWQKNPANFFSGLHSALKNNGRCLILESVLREEKKLPSNEAKLLQNWRTVETSGVPPVTLLSLTKSMVDAGFKIKAIDDVTPNYTKLIADAFAALPMRLVQANIPHEIRPLIMQEVERIGAKAKVMEAGIVAVYRCYAAK